MARVTNAAGPRLLRLEEYQERYRSHSQEHQGGAAVHMPPKELQKKMDQYSWVSRRVLVHLIKSEWERAHEVVEQAKKLLLADPTAEFIAELDMPLRIVNALEDFGLISVEQLIDQTDADLLSMPNIGKTGLAVIDDALEKVKTCRKRTNAA